MDLGPSAKAAVHAGFRQGMTLAAIADKVRADTGETIPVSSLQRYRDYWHATERHVVEAHEKAQELLQAFKDRPTAELQKVLQDTVEAITLNQLVEAHS
ncbi:MAG: hypothetical protein U1C74_16845, partial [Phenylobacterium sp.]|nr:hypothetical protein [Phenylobacterium sp.]